MSIAPVGLMTTSNEGHSLLGVALLGGGARAAYQVGVLAWIADHRPEFPMSLIAGVSAGAANAVGLAGLGSLGESVARLRENWKHLDPDQIFDTFPSGRPYSLFGCLREAVRQAGRSDETFQGLFDDKPIRAFVSSCTNLPGIRANVEDGRLHAVALTASSYDTGKSTTFFQGQPSLKGWSRDHGSGVATTLTLNHIMASGAIPLLFPPVRIGDGLYGDGNVRQQFPLSPLIRLGADHLFVIDPGPSSQSVQARGAARGTLAETIGLVLDSMVVDRIEGDVARLGQINDALDCELLSKEGPNRRRIDLLLIRPEANVGAMAASLGPPRSRALRLFARAAGGWDERVAGLLSYLWVDRRFTDLLFDLGYADARARGEEIEHFLSRSALAEPPRSRAAG